jgi:hypothetical protein
MRVVDHHELWIECYDHDAIGSDDLIGKCKLSLLPVFKRGLIDTWVTIKEETEWGKPKPVRSPRFEVLRCLHAIDATRVHLTMTWVVSFSILSEFGRDPREMLRAGGRHPFDL